MCCVDSDEENEGMGTGVKDTIGATRGFVPNCPGVLEGWKVLADVLEGARNNSGFCVQFFF